MAPSHTLPSRHSSARSILSLDKSTAPFSEQIHEACEFLNIALPAAPNIERSTGQDCEDAPRREWTLRWLLKNLRSSTQNQDASSCLVPQAWLLFAELVARISLTATSRLLKAYEFPLILRDTLRLLQENLPRLSEDEPSNSSSPADSSSATLDVGGEAEQRPSKRRRLSEERVNTPTLRVQDVGHLYTCVTSSISLLLDLTQSDTLGFAVEHLKAALATPSEPAAETLASAFRVVSYLFQHRSRQVNAGLEDVDTSISLIIRYWGQSQASAKPPDRLLIPRYFSQHCLLPTLQLLHVVNPTACTKAETDGLSQIIENLIVEHILLPARLSQLNATQPRANRDPDIPTNQVGDLLALINAGTNMYAWTQNSAIPAVRIFRLALGCRPRRTPKERRIEQSWLQELFMSLAEKSAFYKDSLAYGVEGQSIACKTMSQMLQSAIDNDFYLENPFLERILQHLFKEIGVSVEGRWKIVQLCTKMNPDLFTVMSRHPTGGGQSSQQSPSVLLQALFKDIITRDSELYDENTRIDDILDEHLGLIGDTTDISYHQDLKDVTIELARGFAQSRKFPSFLHYWEEQILASQRSGSIWHESLWWGLWLQLAIEELVEPWLTVEQIQRLLSTTTDELTCPAEDGRLGVNVIKQRTAKSLVLDCILSGCTSDFAIGRLAETVSSLYQVSSNLVMQSRNEDQRFRSSSWKVLATINERWPKREDLPGLSLEIAKAAFRVIVLDSEEVNGFEEGFPDWTKAHAAKTFYNEKLQAFKFIVSVASLNIANQKSTLSDEDYSLIVKMIKGVIDRFQMSEVGEQYVGHCSGPWWNGRAEPRNEEEFAIACLAHIIQCQPVLFHLPRDVQSRVFREVYDGALKDAILMSVTVDDRERKSLHLYRSHRYKTCYLKPDTQLYLPHWLWTRLVQLIFASGDPQMRAYFCEFLVAKYLQHSGYDQTTVDGPYGREGGVIRANDAALELLQIAPMASFTKIQRINVANRIVQQLVNRRFGEGTIAEALHMLTRLIRFPTKSVILKHATLPTDPTCAEDTRSDTIILFAIAGWLDILVTKPDISFISITELKHLTIALLKYLTSNSTRSSSADYLLTLYRHVKVTLDRGSSLDHGAATSALIGNLLEFYCHNDWAFPAAFREEFNDRSLLRRSHFVSLGRSIEVILGDGGSDSVSVGWSGRFFLTLQTLGLYSDLLAPSGDTRGFIENITRAKDSLRRDVDFARSCQAEFNSIEQLLGNLKRRLRESCESPGQIIENELSMLREDSSSKAQKRKLSQFQRWVTDQDIEVLLGLLSTVIEERDDRELDYEELLLSESLLASAIAREESARLKPLFPRIGHFWNHQLLQASDVESSIVAIRCARLMLRSLPKSTAQHHIEELLSATAVTASKLQGKKDHKYIGVAYHGLCKLLATVLLLHRRKLGGRYSLTVPALQSLLGCLFVPYDSSATSSQARSQAKQALWLDESHAAAYARLLTAVCDPTVSSVSRVKRSSREDLNDETKKARAIAGQSIQRLIEEYCECQLKGRLSPEMKAALNPGLYAALSVMQQDVMRNLHAAMGSSSRSIFKALYDDFKRQGQRSGA